MADKKFDEVGARYKVGDKVVDANGNEIKEAKKPTTSESKEDGKKEG